MSADVGPLVVVGPHGRGTARRALASVLQAAGLAAQVDHQPGLLTGRPVLDLRRDVVVVDGRVVPVVLTTPRPGEVGVVEDLLVDRAFHVPGVDVPGEATALASLGDLAVGTLDELRWQLGAAALARAVGASAASVVAGLRACPPDPHRHLYLSAGVAWVQDPAADPFGPRAYDRVVWVLGSDADLVAVADRLRAVVVTSEVPSARLDALRRHAPEVPVLTVPASDTEPMRHLLDRARTAAHADDTVLLAVPAIPDER